MKLENCPFCGGEAEGDAMRAYRAMNGKYGCEVAIYCLKCNADMSMAQEDFPEYSIESLQAILTESWNHRVQQKGPPG